MVAKSNNSEMPNVLTLVGRPLPDRAVADIAARLNCPSDSLHILQPGEAVDIPFAGVAPEQVNADLEPERVQYRIDAFAQPVGGRRKKLLIADMDSTIIACECVDEMAAAFGLKTDIAAITAAAMAGEIEFADALRRRVGLMRNMPADRLDAVYRERVAIRPGAATLVRTMAANGAMTALVSGGFTFFTEKIAAEVGFHHQQANRLEIAGGRLTGNVVEPILDANAKVTALQGFIGNYNLALPECLTIGDGANDIPMLTLAGLGIAFHATPHTRAATPARIDYTGLTTALFYQGYRAAEFVE